MGPHEDDHDSWRTLAEIPDPSWNAEIPDPGWDLEAAFKHLLIGLPPTPVCVLALTKLVGELVDDSEVEVSDTSTCWLCLAIEDWAARQGVSVESASIPW